ncbi:MAG: FISUMP domain-containing protein [bacterium]
MIKIDCYTRKNKGFTMIELLIAIVIIGIISTFISVALNNSRLKARDAKRVSDLKQIQGALEIYKIDEGTYPSSLTPGSPLTGPTSGITYMNKVPSNPSPRTDGGCPNSDYFYTQLSSGADYTLYYCIGSEVQGHVAGSYSITPTDAFAEGFLCGTDTISYGGQTYNTVLVGTQCWFATYLNVGTRVAGGVDGTQGNNCPSAAEIEKYCYGDSDANCTTYGGMYDWDQAMCGSTTAGAQGACPSGWHIPTDAEVKTLEMSQGMSQAQADTENAYRTTTGEGTKLKVGGSSGWEGKLGGTFYPTNFSNVTTLVDIWTSTAFSSSNAWRRRLSSSQVGVYRDHPEKVGAYYVRCLKD